MIAIWFVYSPDGSAQNWIYGQGIYDPSSSSVTIPAVLLTGAKFPPNFKSSDVHQSSSVGGWGSLYFIFSDCNNGVASWHSDLAGYNGANESQLPIQRLTQIAGTVCPQ